MNIPDTNEDWEGKTQNAGDFPPEIFRPDPTDKELREKFGETEVAMREEIEKWKDEAEGRAPAIIKGPPNDLGKGEDAKKNEKLLIDIDCVKDSETGDYHLIIKAGIRIGSKEVFRKEKEELSDILFERIKKLVEDLNQKIKNKATLIELLK